MPLTTRCTRCRRQFPVYAQQLKTHRGQVDCPHCGERLDAVAGLVDEAGVAGAAPLNRGRADAGAGTGPGANAARRRAEPRETRLTLTPAMVPTAGPAPTPARRTVSIRAPTPPPPPRRSTRARRHWGRLSLVLGLSVLLGVQLVWWRRAELLRDPNGFHLLNTWCGYLGCHLAPPRLPGALAVREPSLNPDAVSGALMLRLTIGNSAELPQPAPLIELELYDQQGDLTAVRRFSPSEYAAAPGPGGAGHAAPIAPHEARVVALALAPPSTEASGFKVRLR
ncbi:zinc-ribbon and DUF3426 domain-containing protein [uncultured Thiodictyon sp.]|uniref:zinc-ribbon and DUF3426 domain-containing protein n=1 Tax=uncultured Thiodictyon sp. TaxID=1846217 RepID=UPI0025CDE86F|nr:zinc-ribbon and DUF3426 domain-containing protein [uncultured Thiodictyon sp.]